MRNVLWVLCLAGCVSPPSPADDPPRPKAPSPVARAPVPPAPPPLPPNAEVEIGGTLTFPKGVTGDAMVYVADGECWKPETRAFAEKLSRGTDFFSEVFVPQGTRLWLCAAMIPKKGRATMHGTLTEAPLMARGAGEVLFGNLRLTLAKGPPVDPIKKKSEAGPVPPAVQPR